jgi:integrase
VRKPSAKRQRAVAAPSLAVVERMRAHLLADRRRRDATLLVVLAYAGLRPQEALPCRGTTSRPHPARRSRPKRRGLEVHQDRTHALRASPGTARGRPRRMATRERMTAPDDIVFPTAGGELWRDHDWRNWRRRVFDPLAADVGVSGMRPYDLRHAFCSRLIAEGLSVVEVARQAGHAPTMTFDTYAHVMADVAGADRRSAETAIRAAREGEVSGMCPPEAPTPSQPGQNPSIPASRRPDSNRGPLHYQPRTGVARLHTSSVSTRKRLHTAADA